MGHCAVETVLCWSVRDDLWMVEYFRGSDHYVFAATAKSLPQVQRLVGQCAANPELSLTWFDAARITQALRQVVPQYGEWVEVEAAPVEIAVEAEMSDSGDVHWLGWILIGSCAFWVWFITFTIRGWR